MKKMQEIMKRDEQIARELAEELEQAERDRNKKNEQLNISLDRGATMRSASAERPTNTKKKPKKKVASHLDLGEQVKLHNNLKGIVRFVGIVHWTKEEMVGIEILGDGKVILAASKIVVALYHILKLVMSTDGGRKTEKKRNYVSPGIRKSPRHYQWKTPRQRKCGRAIRNASSQK